MRIFQIKIPITGKYIYIFFVKNIYSILLENINAQSLSYKYLIDKSWNEKFIPISNSKNHRKIKIFVLYA